MAQKWTYRTAEIELQANESDLLDSKVETLFNHLQNDGWEYVSGPVIDKYAGGEADYLFMIRKPRANEPEDMTGGKGQVW